MADQLNLGINLVARDQMSGPVKAADRAVEGLGKEAAQTERKVESLGSAFDKAATDAKEFTGKLNSLRPAASETASVLLQGLGAAVGVVGGVFAAAAMNSQALQGELGRVGESAKGAFGALGDAIANGREFQTTISALSNSFDSIADSIRDNQKALDETLGPAFSSLREAAIEAAPALVSVAQSLFVIAKLAGPMMGLIMRESFDMVGTLQRLKQVLQDFDSASTRKSMDQIEQMILGAAAAGRQRTMTFAPLDLGEGRTAPGGGRSGGGGGGGMREWTMAPFDFGGPSNAEGAGAAAARAEMNRKQGLRGYAGDDLAKMGQGIADQSAGRNAPGTESYDNLTQGINIAADALIQLANAGEISAQSMQQFGLSLASSIGGAIGGPWGAVIQGVAGIASGLLAQQEKTSTRGERRAAMNDALRWNPAAATAGMQRPIVIYQTINGTYVRESDASRVAQDAAIRYARTQGRG